MTDEQLVRIACPQCGKQVKTSIQAAGQKIACPNCSAQVKIPGQAPAKNDDDDWLLLDDDKQVTVRQATADGTKKSNSASQASNKKAPSKPTPHAEPNDDEEFKLAPEEKRRSISLDALASGLVLEENRPSPAKRSSSQRTDPSPIDEELPYHRPTHSKSKAREEREVAPVVAPRDEEEFRFTCRVCGSILYQRRSAIGKEVQCPDCHSKLIVPKPKEPPTKTPKHVPVDEEELRIAPPDGQAKSDALYTPDVVKETLERAKAALEEEEEELESSTYDFDTSGWLLRTFSFLRDPAAIAILLMYGLVVGLLLMIFWWIETLQESYSSGILFIGYLLLIGFATPVILSLIANARAVLESAANEEKQVQSWPLFDMGEWISESGMPLFALSFSAIPGSLIFALTKTMDLSVIGVGGLLVCTWLFFPFFFLSMLDNNTSFNPISTDVWRSLKTCSQAWGAMVLQNAIISFALWLLYVFARTLGPLGGFMVGFGIAFYAFFVFQQVGVLASRIADVTSLKFEKSDKDESSD